MFAVGIGAMVWLWKTEWDQNAPPAEVAVVTGCQQGVACNAPWSECIEHPDFPEGLCSAPCALSRDCPGDFCCLDPSGAGRADKMRCLPATACKGS